MHPYCKPNPNGSSQVRMAYSEGGASNQAAQKSVPLDRCGMAHAARLLGDKWTLLIVREALYGVTRFDAMQAELALPRSVLSDRLKRLVEAGVLKRRPYKDAGKRVRRQYVLTPMGVDLALPLMALMQWGEKHLLDAPAVAEIVERGAGAPLRVGLATASGKPVALHEARFRLKP